MKKRLLILVLFLSTLNLCLAGDIKKSEYTGRWAEKISERVVMDIMPDVKDNEYRIYITWRENNLAQKDIYRFKAKKNKNGELEYKDGVHIYRFFESKNKFSDKTDYKDGSGKITIKDNKLIWADDKDKNNLEFIPANKSFYKNTTVSNRLFSFLLPQETEGFYETKIKKDRIEIYDKSSKKAGFGGFAFAYRVYKNPADHAILPGGEKVGEFTDKKGILYDMVLKYPTDVQYDYVKGINDSYKVLYDFGKYAAIAGKNGSVYHKNQGTKGEDLYREVIKKHIKAIKEKWDSSKLEEENMSYMYNVLSKTNKNVLDKIGYAFYDANGDGIDELVIGEIGRGIWKGVVYDMYTMIDRKPSHVISGGSRDRYYVCNDTFICNEYSSGAKESGMFVYILIENSSELYPQVGFKYDAYENEKNPWFISYNFLKDEWENYDKKEFDSRKVVFNKYERFEYTPLSKYKE